MIDDKLAIAGELTWQEVIGYINPSRAFTRARRIHPSERGQRRKRLWVEILFFWGAYRLRSLLGLA